MDQSSVVEAMALGQSFASEAVIRIDGRPPWIWRCWQLPSASSNAGIPILQEKRLLNQGFDPAPLVLVEEHVLLIATVAVVAFHGAS